MKKVFIFLILLCLIFGSNNYQDLGQMAIITNIAISNKQQYHMIFQEVVPQKSDHKIENHYRYYTVKGSTIKECLKNMNELITKEVYLNYLENVIIDDQDQSIFDHLDHSLKDDFDHFNIVYTHDNIEKVIKYQNNYHYINQLIPHQTTYQDMRKNRLNNKKTTIPVIQFKDKKLVFYKYMKVR